MWSLYKVTTRDQVKITKHKTLLKTPNNNISDDISVKEESNNDLYVYYSMIVSLTIYTLMTC